MCAVVHQSIEIRNCDNINPYYRSSIQHCLIGFIFAFTCSFAQIMQCAIAVTISQSRTVGEVNVRRGEETRRGDVLCLLGSLSLSSRSLARPFSSSLYMCMGEGKKIEKRSYPRSHATYACAYKRSRRHSHARHTCYTFRYRIIIKS